MGLKIIVLGNTQAGDDGAAVAAAKQLALGNSNNTQLILAGRPGTGLLDLLEGEQGVILLDVTRGSGAPGQITQLPLERLTEQLQPTSQTSSHGFGPTEVLSLGKALGTELPDGYFIGIEGKQFEPGETLSQQVQCKMPSYVDTIQALMDSRESLTP